MQVISTRNKNNHQNSLTALHLGLAQDGGLFVPLMWPSFDLKELIQGNLIDIETRLLTALFDDINSSLIQATVEDAFKHFNHPKLTPLVKVGQPFVLELFHGPSAAFKDIALQILPRLLNATHSQKGKTLVLTATSGDTGSAALEGFKNLAHFDIAVLYPSQGTSTIQRKQMTCVDAPNVKVYAIEGNFDDAQRSVKTLFTSNFAKEHLLSSANSINLGRLVPQIAYYFDAYRQLVESKVCCLGDEIVVSVPTGNFGNILAAYYAKHLGCPIKHFICASNENDVLTEFLQTGTYSTHRNFKITSSPSMDILVSSNLERLLFELTNHNDIQIREWMKALNQEGRYTLDALTFSKLKALFSGWMSTEQEIQETILETHQSQRYVLDPHSAVAMHAAKRYQNQHPDDIIVVAATASPYKFPKTVLKALKQTVPEDDFKALHALHALSLVPIPQFLLALEQRLEIHTQTLNIQDVEACLRKDFK